MALAVRLWWVVDAAEAKHLEGARRVTLSRRHRDNRRGNREGSRELCMLARLTAVEGDVAKEGRVATERLPNALVIVYKTSAGAWGRE
jgi:hypothetical protein